MVSTVLVTDYSWPDLDVERELLSQIGADLVVAETGEEAELRELAPSADAILTCWKKVPASVLEAAPRCVTVARYGVGLDNIDLAAATRLGIVVTNVPTFCTVEVADHTMALILAHARHVVGFANATAAGRWDNRACGPMRRLRGRVLGLVGYGNTAREVAARARAFGYEVLAHTPSRVGAPPEDGVRFAADLDELLTTADIVSLHAPITPATIGLIGGRELALMKPDALLVNTSRGALIDESALIDALQREAIGGAALDVLDAEPPPAGHLLAAMPGVIVTPHAAFDSLEAIAELQETAARNVVALLSGELPATVVNREVLDSPSLRMAKVPR